MSAEPCRLVADLGLDRLPTIGLPELLTHAAQLHRVDRKYLVHRDRAAEVIAALAGSHRILKIGDRLTTSYRSTYFDTHDLAAARHHLQRRRRRWKVRTRRYLEDDRSQLEVKTTSLRGQTLKTIDPTIAGPEEGVLEGSAAAFVDATLQGQQLGPVGASLRRSLQVTYERATLADPDAGIRLTIDSGVVSTGPQGRVWVAPEGLVVETTGHLRPGLAARALVAAGVRPQRFSKYVSAASLLHAHLPDNDVRRLLGRQLHVERTPGAA